MLKFSMKISIYGISVLRDGIYMVLMDIKTYGILRYMAYMCLKRRHTWWKALPYIEVFRGGKVSDLFFFDNVNGYRMNGKEHKK